MFPCPYFYWLYEELTRCFLIIGQNRKFWSSGAVALLQEGPLTRAELVAMFVPSKSTLSAMDHICLQAYLLEQSILTV